MPQEPRIPRLSEADALAAAKQADLPEAMATLNVFRVLLHHPELTQKITGLLTFLLFQGKLDARLRELAIMRIGWVTKAEYEWTQHWAVALRLKVSEEELLAVRDWEKSDRFGEAEQAVLAATDETLRDGFISRATFERCRAALPSELELLELVAAIGNWRLFSQLLQSLDIPLEDGMEAWPPDGLDPRA